MRRKWSKSNYYSVSCHKMGTSGLIVPRPALRSCFALRLLPDASSPRLQATSCRLLRSDRQAAHRSVTRTCMGPWRLPSLGLPIRCRWCDIRSRPNDEQEVEGCEVIILIPLTPHSGTLVASRAFIVLTRVHVPPSHCVTGVRCSRSAVGAVGKECPHKTHLLFHCTGNTSTNYLSTHGRHKHSYDT
jgi:hypothetical protein